MPAFNNLRAAMNHLKKDPSSPVCASVDNLHMEIRALAPKERPADLREYLAELGPWEGESLDELLTRLKEARQSGGSAKPPYL